MHRKTRSDNFAFLGSSWGFDGPHVLSSPSHGQGCSTESCSMDTDTAGPHHAADADDDMLQQHMDRRKAARRVRAVERPPGSPSAQGLPAPAQTANDSGLMAGLQSSHAFTAVGHVPSSSCGVAPVSAHRPPAPPVQSGWPPQGDGFPAAQHAAAPAGQTLQQGAAFPRSHSYGYSRSHSQSFSDGQQSMGCAAAAALPPLPPPAGVPHHRRHPSSTEGLGLAMSGTRIDSTVDLGSLGLQPLPLPEAAAAAPRGRRGQGGTGAGLCRAGSSQALAELGRDASLWQEGGAHLQDSSDGAAPGNTAGGGSQGRARGRRGRAAADPGGAEGEAGQGAAGGVQGRREGGAREKQRGGNGKTSRELLLLDPKRVRRIIANRMSAAKSKERKQQYTEQLTQMLDDSAAAREALARQEERLRRDTAALEAFLLDTERQATQLTAHLAALRQEGRLLLHQLQAARLQAGQDPAAPPPVAAPPAAAPAPGARPWAELLCEPLSAEDVEALKAAGGADTGVELQQQQAQCGGQAQQHFRAGPSAPRAAAVAAAAAVGLGAGVAAHGPSVGEARAPVLPPRAPSQTGCAAVAPAVQLPIPCTQAAQQQGPGPVHHAGWPVSPAGAGVGAGAAAAAVSATATAAGPPPAGWHTHITPAGAGAPGAAEPPMRRRHRPTQSADAATLMQMSQLGFCGAMGLGPNSAGPHDPGAFRVPDTFPQQQQPIPAAGCVAMGAAGVVPFGVEGRQSLSLPGPMDVARARAEAEALAAAAAERFGKGGGQGGCQLQLVAEVPGLRVGGEAAALPQFGGPLGMNAASAMDCNAAEEERGVGVGVFGGMAAAPVPAPFGGLVACSAGAVCGASGGAFVMGAVDSEMLGLEPSLLPPSPLAIPSRQVTTSMCATVTTEVRR